MEGYVCSKCREPIADPLCNDCRTKQLSIWASQAGIDPRMVSRMATQIRKYSDSSGVGNFLCVVCGSNLVSECMECYLSDVRKAVEFYLPENVGRKIMERMRKSSAFNISSDMAFSGSHGHRIHREEYN